MIFYRYRKSDGLVDIMSESSFPVDNVEYGIIEAPWVNRDSTYKYMVDDEELRQSSAEEMLAFQLKDLKAEKDAIVDRKTNQIISKGFEWDDEVFSLSSAAQLNWGQLYNLRAVKSYPYGVSLKDNSEYAFADEESVAAFYEDLSAAIEDIVESGREIKLAILAAADASALAAIEDNR